MQPSPLQRAILEATENGTASLRIVARAGTGKTSTLMLVYGIPNVKRSSVFLAFNKSIAETLKDKGIANASTFHALGFRAIARTLAGRNRGRRMQVDARKVPAILDRIAPHDRNAHATVARLVSLVKNNGLLPDMIGTETIDALIDHFDIDIPKGYNVETLTDLTVATLRENNADTLRIDFDDMLYFVVVFDARLDTYAFILTDEAQDTNAIQRDILRRMMAPHSRLIAVGDDRQAIYGFRGASHDAMDLMTEEFGCVTLPLNVSYRCPRLVIEAAKWFVPDIEARPDAPDGTVAHLPSFKRSEFRKDDLIVCRNSAPLVTTAYKMLASRIPCKIMGREIGKGLTSLVKKVSRAGETLESLSERIGQHKEKEVTAALAKHKEAKAQAIADKCDAIIALIDSMTSDDIDGGIPRLIAIIDGMFADTANGVTTLATIHKSKGLEAPRVFILDAELMPSKYARQEWQVIQENNLHYVAITRSLDTLYYVASESIVD